MNRISFFGLATVWISAIFLAACSQEEKPVDNYLEAPVCASTFTPKSHTYQVVGFYPSWKTGELPMNSIRWDKITRLVYAFAIPNADGTIDTGSLGSISQLVDQAHANGVELYVSVGGGSGSENFPVLATNEKTRTKFVKEVREFVFANCLDGVDIDWEYWSGSASNTIIPAESNALVSLLAELKQELQPFNLGISIDLSASHWGGKHIFDDVRNYADHIQVMAYDFTGPWSEPGPHSSFEDAIGSGSGANAFGLAYWVNYRGWPAERILLGVPFYGRDFDISGGAGVSYSDILASHPDAYLTDRVDNIYYNGVGTITDKTQYVIDHAYSGVMIWEIAQDSPVDSVSLLNAIDRTIVLNANRRLP